ncbi:MAG: hypothetical protein V3S60_02625 [Acidimicrobiia bacterium]
MTDTRRGRISRWATGVLLLAIAITSWTTRDAVQTDGDRPVYPNAPIEITSRWWLTPDVAQVPDSSDPEEQAAAQVLQSFFGSDSAEAMAPVSIGPARVFADFMIVMEAISGRHPMEEVISRRVPRVVGSAGLADLQIEGEITEDRSTGSGTANRTIFDQFVMRPGSDGQLYLVDFRRDGIWISELIVRGGDVRSVETAVRIVAVIRSTLGRYMVAGVISETAAEQWSLSDAQLSSIDGEQEASPSFSEIGAGVSAGLVPFLITFNDGGLADQGGRLVLPPLDDVSQSDLVFEIPSLGVPRDGGDVSGG